MPQPVLEIGSLLAGRYEVETVIAAGGFATVYVARHLGLRCPVALKVLKPDLADNPKVRKRFLREARVVTALRHPGIVVHHDLGEEPDGRLYLAMELLDGHSLARVIRGGLSPARAVHILRQLAEALDFAHESGVLHRDLKPSNVMVVPYGGDPDHVKLIDFGVLKFLEGVDRPDDGQTTTLTEGRVVIGTPEYMAPEQIRALPLTARSDQYALGLVAWEMFAGERPFRAATRVEVMSLQLRDPPPPLTLAGGGRAPEGLDAALRRALAKAPERRFGSCRELAEAVARACTGLVGAAEPGTPLPSLPRMVIGDGGRDGDADTPTVQSAAGALPWEATGGAARAVQSAAGALPWAATGGAARAGRGGRGTVQVEADSGGWTPDAGPDTGRAEAGTADGPPPVRGPSTSRRPEGSGPGAAASEPRRRWLWIAVAGLGLAVVAAGVVLAVRPSDPAAPAPAGEPAAEQGERPAAPAAPEEGARAASGGAAAGAGATGARAAHGEARPPSVAVAAPVALRAGEAPAVAGRREADAPPPVVAEAAQQDGAPGSGAAPLVAGAAAGDGAAPAEGAAVDGVEPAEGAGGDGAGPAEGTGAAPDEPPPEAATPEAEPAQGGAAKVAAKAAPAKPAGWATVSVSVRPTGVVWVDGRRVGEGLVTGLRLRAGPHKIRVANAPLGLSRTVPLDLTAGAVRKLIVDLETGRTDVR